MSESDKEQCSWCGKECDKFYWANMLKGFCCLECTNNYLDSEGFEKIDDPSKSAKVKPEYL